MTVREEGADAPATRIGLETALAVTALVLSVPGAVAATLDLIKRGRTAKRLDALRTEIQRRLGPGDRVLVLNADGEPIDLVTGQRDAVLDRLLPPPR